MRFPSLAALVVVLLPAACALPDLSSFLQGGGDKPECTSDDDCDPDHACNERGHCRRVAAGEGEGEGDVVGEGEGEGDQPPNPQAPTIASLTANTTTVTPEGLVTFTAVVSDPNGAGDIFSGTLDDVATGATYDQFTSAGAGSFTVSIDWNRLNGVQRIDFASSSSRTLRARFVDNGGHSAQRTIAVTLTCGDGSPACAGQCAAALCTDGSCAFDSLPDTNGNAICSNVCLSLTTSAHCGSCTAPCNGTCGAVGDTFQCIPSGPPDFSCVAQTLAVGSVTGTTLGATSLRSGTCGGSGPEVVYSFTAPSSGTFSFDTTGSAIDTVVYLLGNGCADPTNLACNDDSSGTTSLVTAPLTAGQRILVVVDSFSSGGTYALHVTAQ